MLKKILKLEGVKELKKNQQKTVLGGIGCVMQGGNCCIVIYYGGDPIWCDVGGRCINGVRCA